MTQPNSGLTAGADHQSISIDEVAALLEQEDNLERLRQTALGLLSALRSTTADLRVLAEWAREAKRDLDDHGPVPTIRLRLVDKRKAKVITVTDGDGHVTRTATVE